jgi:phosphoribosylformylglycinamidine (FGAM) synthase-like enzyme
MKKQVAAACVVKGIGDYGNAFGIPTVAGEIYLMIANSKSVGKCYVRWNC